MVLFCFILFYFIFFFVLLNLIQNISSIIHNTFNSFIVHHPAQQDNETKKI